MANFQTISSSTATKSNRDWEATFCSWGAAPSDTEQTKCENAERAIRKAISASAKLSSKSIARLRFEKGLRMEIRQRASRRRRQISIEQNANGLVNRLSDVGNETLQAVPVTILKGLEPEIFITEALARIIGLEQLRLWNQNASCKISPLTTEGFGIKRESDRRSATI